MIVLDTNVISELMRANPDPAVFNWVASQPRAALYTTHINEAEIFYGIHALPAGRRRDALSMAATAIFGEDFAGRVLSFNGPAARRYAEIVNSRRANGRPIETFDALIAAIASAANAAVATRDTGGFDGCGVTLINPWQPPIQKP
jgi:predicted nucleic acid-binding protein